MEYFAVVLNKMKIAAISDIHSNLYALEAVLEDIKAHNADFILCTGDLVGYSPFPNEVLDMLRSHNILSVQGNYDQAIGSRKLICGCDYKEQRLIELAAVSVYFTNQTISDNNRIYLRNLPQKINFKIGKFNLAIVHGSPRKINEPLVQGSKELYEVLKELNEEVLICGHTHIPYFRLYGDKYVINAGTVGKPVDGETRSSYALLNIEDDVVNVEIKYVCYDIEKAAKAIEGNLQLPDDFANMLRTGML